MRGHRGHPAAALLLAPAIVAGFGLACGAGRTSTRGADQAPPAPLAVQVSDCKAIARGPVCELAPDGGLHLWVPSVDDATTLAVLADHAPLRATETRERDGRALRVTVPAGTQVVSVRATSAEEVRTWAIGVTPSIPKPAFLSSAAADRAAGRFDDAVATLEREATDHPEQRASAQALRARINFERGRFDDAAAEYRESIALREAAGRSSEAVDDALALAFLLLVRDRLQEVRPVLAHAASLAEEYPVGRGEVVLYEGRLAWRLGDLRAALRSVRAAEAIFEHLGADRFLRSARLEDARLLEDLGRYEEAVAGYRRLIETDGAAMTPCARALYLEDLGDGELHLAQSEHDPEAARASLEPLRASLDLTRAACADPNRLANVLYDLAAAEAANGRTSDARALLREAERAEPAPDVDARLQGLHLAGRLDLADGAPARALASFERAATIARSSGTLEARRAAAEDRAAALKAMRRDADALAALREADECVDESAPWVPLGEGRQTFLGARGDATALEIDVLARLGRFEEAVGAARRADARVLPGLRFAAALEGASSDARAKWEDAVARYRAERAAIEAQAARDWELSAEHLATALARRRHAELHARSVLDEALSALSLTPEREEHPASPAPDRTVEIVYAPVASAWVAFAREGAGGWSMRRLGSLDTRADPEALAALVLGPFDAEIARADRVRFEAHGALRAVDLHALPWRRAPLLARRAVEYAVEGDRAAPPSSSSEPLHALVVADPASDLPAAGAEVDDVAARLAQGGFTVDVLGGHDATRAALHDGMGATSFLHYAGHARFGGPDGVDSFLTLAGGAELTAVDILALQHVPRYVALFGCETGREATVGVGGGLGLATAFLAAGSNVVVATSRPVADRLAREVASSFYAALAADAGHEPVAALRDALEDVRAREPSADWSAFRALVP